VFFGNPINENQRGEAIPKRGKIVILTPKIKTLQPVDRGERIGGESGERIENRGHILIMIK
jgi:hypothetical protein